MGKAVIVQDGCSVNFDFGPVQPEETDCPACNGTATILGRLGDLDHFRCRACGMESSRPVQS
jgi:hypothetical protein